MRIQHSDVFVVRQTWDWIVDGNRQKMDAVLYLAYIVVMFILDTLIPLFCEDRHSVQTQTMFLLLKQNVDQVTLLLEFDNLNTFVSIST